MVVFTYQQFQITSLSLYEVDFVRLKRCGLVIFALSPFYILIYMF